MRQNKGIPSGEYAGAVGDWNLYKIADARYKICAATPVSGKANYTFAVSNSSIDASKAMDAAKLRAERPDLYEQIESFFQGDSTISLDAKSDPSDLFGDHALGRKRKLTPEQQWKRGLLNMRLLDLQYAAVRVLEPASTTPTWATGVRFLFNGCFKAKISLDAMNAAIAYVTDRTGNINLEALARVGQDYYAGKYAPDHCSQLEIQLDILAGTGFKDKNEN